VSFNDDEVEIDDDDNDGKAFFSLSFRDSLVVSTDTVRTT
jgi:hypothetical protein